MASCGLFACERRQRAIVAGVHRLEHVQRLAAAALADDDAVGAHAQRVHDQVADRDAPRPSTFAGRVSSVTTCGWLQLQLGGVLDRDDALVLGDEAAESMLSSVVLPQPVPPRDHDVQLAAHARARNATMSSVIDPN